jgi:predicted dehydrogenase
MKIALIGAGQRGNIYAGYLHDKMGVEIAAVVDTSADKRRIAAERFKTKEDMLFADFESFVRKRPDVDGAVIASMDRDHYVQAMDCLDMGLDILLEKPISNDIEECKEICRKAKSTGRQVLVCHVLRYTNFFGKIKEIVDSGEIGRIVTIQHAESIGSFHMAHSFVRGNWRNSDTTSPIIMQKSCHDMDILTWLTGSRAGEISSFGNLRYFKRKNAPEGSADRCLDCPVSESCRYDVKKAYLPVKGGWPAEVISEDQSEEGLLKALKDSIYGRCVYKCDNNVCDNQVTNILFENGVTATFLLSGLTDKMHRTIRIMCEDGEIYGDDYNNTIKVTRYSPNALYEGETVVYNVESKEGFHGGGDYGLSVDFYNMLSGNGAENLSSIDKSVESHLMAYAAERSRLSGCTVHMDELR